MQQISEISTIKLNHVLFNSKQALFLKPAIKFTNTPLGD